MNVLIVDDVHGISRRTERVFLKDKDYKCNTTHSPSREDALASLRENNYDLIFLDLFLDGYDLSDANAILKTIFEAPYRHGAVFIISNLADSAKNDPKIISMLAQYPILGIALPMCEDNVREPPEYKSIKNFIFAINSIIKLRERPDAKPKIETKYDNFKKFSIVMLSWMLGLLVLNLILPKISPSFNNLPPEIQIGLTSVPGVLVTIGAYWDKIMVLLSKLIK